jgi:hypothetical protein
MAMMAKREHIPPLDPLQLEAVLARLAATRISPAGKLQIRRMLEAAANPNAEAPEVVIETLPVERRTDIKQTQRAVGGIMLGLTRRGGQKLMALSDEEWNALVDEANAE